MSKGRIWCRDEKGAQVPWGQGHPWIDFSVHGTRVRKRIEARSKAEAEIILAQEIAATCRKLGAAPSDAATAKFGGAIGLWCDQEKRPARELAAVRRIADGIGVETPLPSVTVRAISEWIAGRQGEVRPTTVLREVTALSAFFSWAVGSGLLEANPVRDVRKPSQKWTPPEPLSRKEVKALLAAVKGQPVEPVVVLAYWAGLRRSEIARVAKESFTPQGLLVPGKKTKRARSVIPILPGLAEYRKRHRWRGRFMVAQEDGSPYQPMSLHEMVRRWNRAAKAERKADPKTARPEIPNLHRLRHSIGSHLIEDGHPPHVVASFLRNSIKMVEEVYGHYSALTFQEKLGGFKL